MSNMSGEDGSSHFHPRPQRPLGWVSRDGRVSPAIPPWLVVPDRAARMVGTAVAVAYVSGLGLIIYWCCFAPWWLAEWAVLNVPLLSAYYTAECLILGGAFYLIARWLYKLVGRPVPAALLDRYSSVSDEAATKPLGEAAIKPDGNSLPALFDPGHRPQ
jgi:hypothetical protein